MPRRNARPSTSKATGSWAACSRCIGRPELRRLKTAPLLGPAPRRSALRKNRRLVSAKKTVKLNHAVLLTVYARRKMRYWKIIADKLSKQMELGLRISN
jgi:hypothetical protein